MSQRVVRQTKEIYKNKSHKTFFFVDMEILKFICIKRGIPFSRCLPNQAALPTHSQNPPLCSTYKQRTRKKKLFFFFS